MALNTKFGSFSTGTPVATNTIAVTGVGFQPEFLFFFWSGRADSTDAIGRASHFQGFGAAASTTDRRAVVSTSTDASAAAATASAHDAAACIISVTNTGPAIDGQLDLQSFDADGFTLICDSATWPRDSRIGYMALAGDLTDAATGVLTEPGATGDQDVTSLAFQPDFVMFFGAGIAADAPGAKIDSDTFIGAAVSATGQGVWLGGSNHAATTMSTAGYCTAGECIAMPAANMSSTNARADFVSFLSNGFRINWAERASTRRVHWVALKGGSYIVGNLLTQTDTTTDIVETGFGFAPAGALFVSGARAESASDTISTNDRLSIGGFDSTSSRLAQSLFDGHGSADSEIATANEFDEVYVNIATNFTIAALMDVKSVEADGFTMIMDDADAAQAFVWYMAVGAAAGGGTLSASVADTATLTEALTALLISLISAADTATLTETITANLVSLVTVNETATLTENANALIVSHVTVDETVTTTEAVTVLLTSFVNTSETVTLSEAVTVVVSDPQVSASDTATLTEAVTLLLTGFVNVSETVTVSEAVAVTVSDPQVLAGETVTVSEAVTLLITSFVNVSEAVTVSEAVSAAIEDVAGNPQVVASETVTVSESITVVTSGPQVIAAETVTLTEITTLALMTTVTVSELITLSEALTIPPLLLAGVNVGETVTLTETLTLSGLAVIVTILGSVTGVRATGTVSGVRPTGTLRG